MGHNWGEKYLAVNLVASAGYSAKYPQRNAIKAMEPIRGSPPKSAILTCTQLIPAPNQPAPNNHPAINGRCFSLITWRIASARAGIVKSHILNGAKASVKLAPLNTRRKWGINRFSIEVIWWWLIGFVLHWGKRLKIRATLCWNKRYCDDVSIPMKALKP